MIIMKSDKEIKYKLAPKEHEATTFFRVHKPIVDQKVVKDQPIDELVSLSKVCPHGAIEAGEP